MNRRMIQVVLGNKHKNFVASIKDPEVRKLVDKNSIITGGAIASLLLGIPVNDFDYYFTNIETVKAVADYYVKEFNEAHPEIKIKPKVVWYESDVKLWQRWRIVVQSAGVVSETTDDNQYQYFESLPDEAGMEYIDQTLSAADDTPYVEMEKEDYRPVFLSGNAITLSNKVQLVIRFWGKPEDIHKNYDFIHCCNYWRSDDKQLVLHPGALESLLCKHLQYQGSLYPLCSVIRTRKFLKQGWYINAGQYLKMCFQISELDLSNILVLEEQLTGVDAAYFYQVIEYCKKRMAEDQEFKVTAPYLVSIIDKIFG